MKGPSKFQLVLITVFGALGVAGVLVFALAVSQNTSTAVGAVTIWGTFDEARITAVIRAAADDDGRLTQVTYVKKDPATYESDLAEAIASGKGPDLFFMRQDRALRDAAKTYKIPSTSLSKTQFDSTFLSVASPFITEEGVVGVPLVVDPLVLFWNRDMLGHIGMTEPPRFWDEISDIAQRISIQTDTGTIQKSTIALGSYSNIANAKDILATLILQAGGAITVPDSTGVIVSALGGRGASAATSPALAALSFFVQFANPSRDDYSWNRSLPEAREAFAHGDVALYVGHASEVSQIAQKNPNLSFSMTPLPQIRTGGTVLTTANTYALAVSRAAPNPQGGVTVAYILASPTISQGFASVLNMASSLRSVVSVSIVPTPEPSGAAQNSLQKVIALSPKSVQDMINAQASIARTWHDPDPQETSEIFRAMIEDTVSGATKASDALSRADKQINQLTSQ